MLITQAFAITFPCDDSFLMSLCDRANYHGGSEIYEIFLKKINLLLEELTKQPACSRCSLLQRNLEIIFNKISVNTQVENKVLRKVVQFAQTHFLPPYRRDLLNEMCININKRSEDIVSNYRKLIEAITNNIPTDTSLSSSVKLVRLKNNLKKVFCKMPLNCKEDQDIGLSIDQYINAETHFLRKHFESIKKEVLSTTDVKSIFFLSRGLVWIYYSLSKTKEANELKKEVRRLFGFCNKKIALYFFVKKHSGSSFTLCFQHRVKSEVREKIVAKVKEIKESWNYWTMREDEAMPDIYNVAVFANPAGVCLALLEKYELPFFDTHLLNEWLKKNGDYFKEIANVLN